MSIPIQIRGAGLQSWEQAELAVANSADQAAALAFFRSTLGDGWPGWDRGYHLATQFFTAQQSGLPEGVRLAQMVRALDQCGNIDELVKKDLGGAAWNAYAAAIMTLDFCSAFASRGRPVMFSKRDHGKHADATVVLRDRPVVVELKGMHESEQEKRWALFTDDIFVALMEKRHPVGCLDFDLRLQALLHATETIDALLATAQAGSPQIVFLPFGAGTARYVGTGGGYDVPVSPQDDLKRIKQKMNAWLAQLEGIDSPTLLLVRTRNLFRKLESKETALVLLGLQSMLRARTVPSALLLYEERPAAPPPSSHRIGRQFRLTRGASPHGFSRSAALIANASARHALSADECDLLLGPKMLW